MFKYTFIFLSIAFVFMGSVKAQNNEAKADDANRIAITPEVTDQAIPQGAKNMLLTKMKQICSKNGMAGDTENPFFTMDASVDVLSKELTPTAPPMHALNLQVTFFIKDAMNGNIYSQTSIEIKGVGKNETKAYTEALKNINTSAGQFKALVDQGKSKIIEFYNAQCDLVISKANALKKQGNNAEALKVLYSVPQVCLECYDKCMDIASEIEPPVVEPVAAVPAVNDEDAKEISSASEVEIAEGVFIEYTRCKVLGKKLIVYFNVENRTQKDYEFVYDYVPYTRIIDGEGNEHKIITMRIGSKEGTYKLAATILPDVPVKMECEFPVVDVVKMLEFKTNNNVYRMKQIECSN